LLCGNKILFSGPVPPHIEDLLRSKDNADAAKKTNGEGEEWLNWEESMLLKFANPQLIRNKPVRKQIRSKNWYPPQQQQNGRKSTEICKQSNYSSHYYSLAFKKTMAVRY
jgi:hypothetical protein